MAAQDQPDENQVDARSVTHDRAGGPVPETGAPHRRGVPTGRTWGILLVAGIAAGVCSSLATEGVLRAYRGSLMPPRTPMPTMEDARQLMLARVASGTTAFAAMGGLMGLLFGLAGGAARRSVPAAVKAGAVGLLAGSAVVAGVAWVTLPLVYTQLDPQSHDLVWPLLYHEVLWSVAGALGGLVFGLGADGRGLWKHTAIGGWVGAALAIVVYELLGALVLPTHQAQYPLPGSQATRTLADVLVALGAAIGAAVATNPGPGKTSSG
jgi:hypothetical protein